jgi:hypothetical protein
VAVKRKGLPGGGSSHSGNGRLISEMTDFQLGVLLLLTAFIAGFICGFILDVVLMKRTLR